MPLELCWVRGTSVTQIEGAIEAAKAAPEPPLEDLWNHIYAGGSEVRLQQRGEAATPKLQL